MKTVKKICIVIIMVIVIIGIYIIAGKAANKVMQKCMNKISDPEKEEGSENVPAEIEKPNRYDDPEDEFSE